MGHKAQGHIHYIFYCIVFRSLHRHDVMVQILAGSVLLGLCVGVI
jgi:hypothetical protein